MQPVQPKSAWQALLGVLGSNDVVLGCTGRKKPDFKNALKPSSERHYHGSV